MLTFEKKLYAWIEKYLHFIIAFFVCGVVLFMNRQVLYCFRPYEGADMWEASEVFVHSPIYVLFLRKIWIELFEGNYDLYHMLFWPFSYSVAILSSILLYQYRKKTDKSYVMKNTVLYFSFALITPLALLYGPVMVHVDGIVMTLILTGILLGKCMKGKSRWFPIVISCALAVSLQTTYYLGMFLLLIYGLIKKKIVFVWVPIIILMLSIGFNVIAGLCMGVGIGHSLYMIFRFFIISQATGTVFRSVLSWASYMVFWNGYWLGMLMLFGAFVTPNKAPIRILGHIMLFFFSVSIFFNGYIG